MNHLGLHSESFNLNTAVTQDEKKKSSCVGGSHVKGTCVKLRALTRLFYSSKASNKVGVYRNVLGVTSIHLSISISTYIYTYVLKNFDPKVKLLFIIIHNYIQQFK